MYLASRMPRETPSVGITEITVAPKKRPSRRSRRRRGVENIRIDKYGGHQQREHAHAAVIECDGERCVTVDIGKVELDHDLIGTGRATNQQTNDNEEDP
jgi:hypothetical protein